MTGAEGAEPGPITGAPEGRAARVRAGLARRIVRRVRPLALRAGIHLIDARYDDPVPEPGAIDGAGRAAMPGIDLRVDAQLELLEELRAWASEYAAFPRDPGADPSAYYVANPTFGAVDAEVLHAMVRRHRPARVLEIGSGMSTRVLAAALRRNAADGAPGELVSVDPFPGPVTRGGFAGLDELVIAPVQELPHERYAALGRDDVLFIDSSHMAKIGSDVLHLVLEVLPTLAPGVLVHFHDVYLPWPYPRSMIEQGWYWNEQYLVQALLVGNPGYEVVWSSQLLFRDHHARLQESIPSTPGGGDGPCSLWLRRTG